MISNFPKVSVVVPLYNADAFIAATLSSIREQSFDDFEVIIVNDGSTDNGPRHAERFAREDCRFRVVSQMNSGLAGARNTGIAEARGEFIALLDADDIWHKEKLMAHVRHLRSRPDVGISYSGSQFIDNDGYSLGVAQRPKLLGITAADIFCRNPIGNGSAPVIRRVVLDEVEYTEVRPGASRRCWFDESFRQSEDIELWARIAVTTEWEFEGLQPNLTFYRVNSGGLSSNITQQFESWLRFRAKLAHLAPDLVEHFGIRAEAYQLRYLARRAAIGGDGITALKTVAKAVRLFPCMMFEDPAKTIQTFALAGAASILPIGIFRISKALTLGRRFKHCIATK